MLVFSQWNELLSIMSQAFADNGIGATSFAADKARAPIRFKQDPEMTAFLLNTQKQAAGLTLTAATHVFIVEPLLNPGVELQAVNRVHRIGQ